jgi:hypothetical protein
MPSLASISFPDMVGKMETWLRGNPYPLITTLFSIVAVETGVIRTAAALRVPLCPVFCAGWPFPPPRALAFCPLPALPVGALGPLPAPAAVAGTAELPCLRWINVYAMSSAKIMQVQIKTALTIFEALLFLGFSGDSLRVILPVPSS